jgi:hypothetical protein
VANLNIEYMSSSISLYSAIGGLGFFLFNLVVGVFAFVAKNYPILLAVSCLAGLLEFRLLSVAQARRI